MEDVKRLYYVYCHTLIKDGRKYFGITCNEPKVRWNYGNGYISNRYFFRAIKKYGWDSFQHDILYKELTKETACQLEKELIEKYNTTNKKYGFNISIGGEYGNLGVKFSDEAKRKMSLAKKGRKLSEEQRRKMSIAFKGRKGYFTGKKFTEEHRKHISEGLKGRTVSEETREKIKKALKGKVAYRPNYKHHSEETKMKIRLGNLGKKKKPLSDEHKKKISNANLNNANSKRILCEETGVIFPSIHEASRQMNINSSNISCCCRGVYKKTHGYTFKYVEEVGNASKK